MLSISEPISSPPTISHSSSKSLSQSQTSCHSTPDPLHTQIAQLKEKAHQSFMQVIQIQQLHDEQLDLLRTQQRQKQESLQVRIRQLQEQIGKQEELELRVMQLQNQNTAIERNYKLRFCEMEDDLSIDGVELIPGKQGEMDDEEMGHVREVLELYQKEEEFQAVKAQMVSEVQQMMKNCHGGDSGSNMQNSPLLELTNQIFAYTSSLRTECSRLLLIQSQNQQAINHGTVTLSPAHSAKVIERLEREGKFMAEHIKRLSKDKLRAEKKAAQTERQLKVLQERMGKVINAVSKRGVHLNDFSQAKAGGLLEHDHSLQLDEFISENMRNSCNSYPQSSPFKAYPSLLARSNKG